MQRDLRKEYRALLRDPRWLDFSCEVIEQKGACGWCGSDQTLQVHHLVYYERRLPWEYDLHEVGVLCRECHQTLHEVADECWVKMLRLDLDQLELLSKAISVIGNGTRGAITEKTVTLLRDVNTRRNQASSRRLLPTEWTDRAADYATNHGMGTMGGSQFHEGGSQTCDQSIASEDIPT